MHAIELDVQQKQRLGAVVANLHPLAPRSLAQLVVRRHRDRATAAAQPRRDAIAALAEDLLDLEIFDARIRLADRDELVHQHRIEQHLFQRGIAPAAEVPVIAARVHLEQVLGAAEAERVVGGGAGPDGVLSGCSPAAGASLAAHLAAVHLHPILLPVVIIVPTQHEHDRLAARRCLQLEFVPEQRRAFVADFRYAAQAAQTEIVRRAPGRVFRSHTHLPPGNFEALPGGGDHQRDLSLRGQLEPRPGQPVLQPGAVEAAVADFEMPRELLIGKPDGAVRVPRHGRSSQPAGKEAPAFHRGHLRVVSGILNLPS